MAKLSECMVGLLVDGIVKYNGSVSEIPITIGFQITQSCISQFLLHWYSKKKPGHHLHLTTALAVKQ